MLPSTPVNSSRVSQQGFTLIEISVVLFLIGLMTMLVMPYAASFRLSQLSHSARLLAGRSAFLYDQASSGKLVLRLTFNLDANGYFVSRLDPHSPTPVFMPDLSAGAGPVTLPATVRIRDVSVEGIGTATRGTISCNFYPEGYADATVIHLIDASGSIFTLSVQPLTGQVAILKGDLTPAAAQAIS